MTLGHIPFRNNSRDIQQALAHRAYDRKRDQVFKEAILRQVQIGAAFAQAGHIPKRVFNIGDFRGRFPPGEVSVLEYDPDLVGMISETIGASPNVAPALTGIMLNLLVNSPSGVVRPNRAYDQDEKDYCETQLKHYLGQIPVLSLRFSASDGTNLGNFTHPQSSQYAVTSFSQLGVLPFWQGIGKHNITYIGDPKELIASEPENTQCIKGREDIEKRVVALMDKRDVVILGNGNDKPIEVYRIQK